MRKEEMRATSLFLRRRRAWRASQRLYASVATAIAATGVFVLTLLVPDWIEVAFGVDPDRHSGSIEWAIALAPLAVAVAAGALASLEWLRSRASAKRLSMSSEPR
jgi:hypothetical protein